MKFKVFGLLLGLCTLMLSCKAQRTPQSAIITGKLKINWSNSLKLSNGAITLTDSWIERLSVGDSIIDLNEDGSFRIDLALKKPDFYCLSHESNQVEFFLSPNDSIHIDFNAEQVVSGTSSKLNQHLKSLRGIINTNRRYIDVIDFYGQSSARACSILDSLKLVYLAHHKEFKRTNPVHKLFEQKVIADITYRNKLTQIAHPARFKQQTNELLPVKASYFEDLAKGSFNHPELLKSLDYVLFLESYIAVQAAGDHKFGIFWEAPIEKIHPHYEQIQALNAHQDIKDYLLNEHLNKSIDNYGITYLEDLIPRFKDNCKNQEYVKRMEERITAARETRKEPTTIKVYKTIGNIELEAHIFYPEDYEEGDQRPAYLFFHGGGWSIGTPEWGYKNCKNYSSKGMVAISFEYRLIDIHGSDLLDCVRDAKSAILWTRKQAKSLGIDPNKIVAAGFSAGGHLAACTAILNEYEEANASGLSSKPDAIIVHSASYNTTKNKWFSTKSGGKAESISTFHQVNKNLVPSIFFHGTNDHLAPIKEFTDFRDKMNALGNDYEYKIFENVGHFFGNPAARKEVVELSEAFLRKLGYVK